MVLRMVEGTGAVLTARPIAFALGAGLRACPPGVYIFGLTAKYQLTTALAPLREDPSADGRVRDTLIWHEESNPSPPASLYPLPSAPRRGPLSASAPL
jgi:hypothetical protein